MKHFYDHKKIEEKWQAFWEKEGLFGADDSGSGEKRYILDMFPYPSSAGLHVGHPEGYTATDIVSRFERMRGKNVLHPMGWDAFGLPAENFAIKQGVHPKETTDANIKNFRRQIKALGFSYDWSREVNTADPSYYKWTQWLFLELYKNGLAYKKKAPVNWCESCQTVLAREQVVDSKCERCKNEVIQKDLEQWFFKITRFADRFLDDMEGLDWPEPIKLMQKNWIGKSEGALIKFETRISKFETNSKSEIRSSKQNILYVATGNESKLKRIQMILGWIAPDMVVEKVPDYADVEEDGDLAENSLKKVEPYKGKYEYPVLAVDTGIYFEKDVDLDPVKLRRNALGGVSEKDLSQEEIAEKMNAFCMNIAREHGGRLDFKFKDVFTVLYPDGTTRQEEDEREMVLTDEAQCEMDIYFPISNLYQSKVTGKSLYVQSEKEMKKDLAPGVIAIRKLLLNEIEVFTTRPDTLFGATYIVLAPEHSLVASLLENQESRIKNQEEVKKYIKNARKKSEVERTDLSKEKTGVELQGVKAVNPVNGEEVPIWVADYVLIGYGTGAIMAVPAHDARDFEFAKKYNLPIREVVSGGDVSKEAYVEEGKSVNSGEFDGLETPKFKQKITQCLEEKGVGEKSVNYRLRDWLVSRQRYWGAPIPIIYCRRCSGNNKSQITNSKQNSNNKLQSSNLVEIDGEWHAMIPVPVDQLPVELPNDVDFRPQGESPLARSEKFHDLACPKCGASGDGVRREVDTMDTFVDSSWYFLRYCDVQNEKEFASKETLEKWCPVDLYVGGAEHAVLHLLYARFITKALKDFGHVDFEEPFLKLRNQGMILAEDGRKMSKSLGNVINPDEIVSEYGADTMRLYEMFMGPLEYAKPWNTKSILGVRRFLEKTWLIISDFRFQISDLGNKELDFVVPTDDSDLTRLAHQTIKKVTEDIENFKFNTAISQLMIYVNELSREEKSNSDLAVHYSLLITLLSPFAPHVAEELWELLGNKESVSKQPWPEYDESLAKADTIELVFSVNGKVRDKQEVDADISEEEAKDLALKSDKVQKFLDGSDPKKVIFVKGKLVNIVV